MKNKKITFSSIYVAIFIVLSFIPNTGYLNIAIIQITTLPIFITISTYHLGFLGAMSSSISFGITSFLAGISVNPTPFADPILLIMPRIFLGFFVFAIYKLLGKIKLWKFILLTIVTISLNTTLFTMFLFLVNEYNNLFKNLFKSSLLAWLTIIYVNFVAELIFGIIVSCLIFKTVKHLFNDYKNMLKIAY